MNNVTVKLLTDGGFAGMDAAIGKSVPAVKCVSVVGYDVSLADLVKAGKVLSDGEMLLETRYFHPHEVELTSMSPEDTMNKHILLVMKWLKSPDSVTAEELKQNRKSAHAAAAYAYAAYAYADAAHAYAAHAAAAYAYAAYADAAHADAEKWVAIYFERTGEDRQAYADALKTQLAPANGQKFLGEGLELTFVGTNALGRWVGELANGTFISYHPSDCKLLAKAGYHL